MSSLPSDRSTAGGPICVHGHKISLPLLADFPKKRRDVNPFKPDAAFARAWGSLTLEKLGRTAGSDPILVFLDSHTINNVRFLDIDTYDGDVYLFVGDTQHGSLEGFRALIEMARQRCVKKLFFVNNPQHAHWFARTPEDFDRFAFLPVGLANYEQSEAWERRFVQDRVVHVGNIQPGHAYRRYVLEGLQEQGAQLAYLRTPGYRQANSIYSAARAALNISLNSDLSFRLSEIMVSGGLCISDELGFVQRENLPFKAPEHLLTFDSVPRLLDILSDLYAGKIDRPAPFGPFEGKRLESLDDVASFARPIREPRLASWSALGGNRGGDLRRYIEVRDACIHEVEPIVELEIASIADVDFLLDILDLPRLKIMVRCSSSLIRLVECLIDRFEARHRAWLRILAEQ